MLSDAPHYVKRKATQKTNMKTTAEDEANEIAGFFLSKLNE